MATTAKQFRLFTGGLILSVAALFASCAQGQYGQPNYPQNPPRPDYSQQRPDYDYQQPGYDDSQRGYDDQQPGYDDRYNRPNFYGDLAPHGQWVNTPEYGRVWIPNVGPDFQPYASNGHWVWTEYGNTWVSDYDWGWAPFHYGRWYRDRYRGWAWVPGYDWGPAWVSWRSGAGYYGWAPLGPGLNVNINIPAPYWVFVPQAYVTHPRLYSYCVPRPQVVNIYNTTTIINNTYRVNNRNYGYGPRREDLERATRQQVPVYRVENTRRPGRDQVRDNTVGIYRPDAGRPDGGRTYGPSTGTGSSRGGRVYNEPYSNSSGSRDNARGRQVPAEALPAPGAPATTPNVPNRRGRGNYGSYGERGNYGGYGERGNTPRAEPAPATAPTTEPASPTYPPSGSGSSRGSRNRGYEAPTQPAPTYQQPAPTYQQPAQTYPQPAPTYPAPSAPQPSQREWGGRRSGSYSPAEPGAPASPQAQPQRNSAEGAGAGQPAPSPANTGRGSSRGRGGN